MSGTTQLQILFQDENMVAIHKPPGFHVHQPEMHRRVPKNKTVLWTLRRQIEQFLYPVHRLDVATEGVLVMALSSERAGLLQEEFKQNRARKTYHAVCRGWMDDEGSIDLPLERDSNGTLADALTRYQTLARVECPFPIGKRYQTARFSFIEAKPESGRWHQLRRHFARTTHPIIGDREHGDSNQNRYFREKLGIGGLWLRASHLSLLEHELSAPLTDRWRTMGGVLGFDVEKLTHA